MIIRRFAFGFGATLALASGAAAQDTRLGSRLERPTSIDSPVVTGPATIAAVRAMAQCYAHRRPNHVIQLLNSDSENGADRIERNLFRDVQCSNMTDQYTTLSISAPRPLMRGALAEEMLRTAYADRTPDGVGAKRDYDTPWAKVAGRDPAFDEMAVCVAETDPRGIRTVIATANGSQQEIAAFRALTPSLGNCLRANQRLTADRVSTRAALAEALYHRVATPAASAKTK